MLQILWTHADRSLAAGILLLMIAMLVSNRVRLDVVGLVVLSLVAVFHLVPSTDLFGGFSSYAAVVVAAMFALGEGLRQAGATDLMASFFERVGRRGEGALTAALLVLPPIPSTFISDVGLMGIFLPTMARLRQQLRLPVQRLLLPLAIAIALGGLLSMVGSAGNIIGNATLTANGIRPLGLFAITPVGALLVVVGLLFMRLWGLGHLGPRAAGGGDSEFLSDYPHIKAYMTEITVDPASPLTGLSLADIPYFRQHAVRVIRIFRSEATVLDPGPLDILRPADRLLVQGSRTAVLTLCEGQGLHPTEAPTGNGRLRAGGMRVVEALVPPRSVLVSHTLRETRFRTRFGLTVLGVLRQGITRAQILPDLRLQAGDVLLVQGDAEAIARADLGHDLLVLADAEHRPTSGRRAALAVAIVAGVLAAAALNLLSLQAAAALGIVLMVATRLLSLDQAYRAIDWRIVVLIGGITPLSLALTRDGLTAAVAHLLLQVVGPFGPLAVLAVFFWLAALLTQVISNVAAALILAPLAVGIAGGHHWSPYPLIVAMVVALSAAPLTPLANKVFLMAMGPGRYRYQDFFRIGLPLTLLMFLAVMLTVPATFPFAR